MQRSDDSRSWIPSLLVALGLGAAAGSTVLRPAAPAPPPPSSTVEGRARATQSFQSSQRDDSAVLSAVKPIMRLLGDTLESGVGPDVEIRAALTLHRYLCSLPDRSRTDIEALKATTYLIGRLRPELKVDPCNTDDAARWSSSRRSAGGLLQGTQADYRPTWRAMSALAAYPFDKAGTNPIVAKAREQLVTYFAEAGSDLNALRRLRKRAADLNVVPRFLVATISDYVDSNSGWLADQQLEAIQAAMAAQGFLLERFYLPDWKPHQAGADAARTAAGDTHETEPGAVIFRRYNERCRRTDLWVVLLVTESPTSGIHRRAFRNAARFIHEWHEQPGDKHKPDLRVLGPTYSGSALSLRWTLDDLLIRENQGIRSARIVSGSANADSNLETLTGGAERAIEFHATVRPASDVLSAFQRHLGSLNDEWRTGHGMAILIETNTAFGNSAMGGPGAPSSQRNSLTTAFEHATFIPFPLHISRLRQATTDAQGQSGTNGLPWPGRSVAPLTARDAVAHTDQLPSITPDMTAASVQTTVSHIFSTIARERFTAVGIVATDERDVVYLAREARRAAPNAQLFMMGAHMLYLHPEAAPYTRGSLVASSYPLANWVQPWTVPAAGNTAASRRQFQGMLTEGLYNATLVLTGESTSAPLIDYAVPGGGGVPPVWISVVARDGFRPVAVDRLPPRRPYTHRETVPGANTPRRTIPLSMSAIAASLLLCIAVLWHGYVVVRQIRGACLWLAWHAAHGHRLLQRGVMSLVVALASSRPRLHSMTSSAERRHHRLTEAGRLAAPGLHQCQDNWRRDLIALTVDNYYRVFTLPRSTQRARLVSHGLMVGAFTVLGAVTFWLLALWGLPDRLGAWVPIAAALGVAGVLPASLLLTYRISPRAAMPGRSKAGQPAKPSSDTHQRATRLDRWPVSSLLLTVLLVGLGGLGLTAFCAFVWSRLIQESDAVHATLILERTTALTSLVSPAIPIVLLLAAIYLFLWWQLNRLNIQGPGYRSLAGMMPAPDGTVSEASPMFSLFFEGSTDGGAFRHGDRRLRFARFLDAPIKHMPQLLGGGTVLAVVATLPVAAWLVLRRVTTLDGPEFTWFLRLATALALAGVLTAFTETLALWRELQRALVRQGRAPIADAFARVSAFSLDWRLRLRQPRRDELWPLARLAEALRDSYLSVAWDVTRASTLASQPSDREEQLTARLNSARKELTSPRADFCDDLTTEAATGKVVLLESPTWSRLWQLSDRLVLLLDHLNWSRRPLGAARLPEGGPEPGGAAVQRWVTTAETMVALQFAFVIRDLLSRIVSGLTVVMTGLFLILGSHLFYLFQGRAALLTVDWLLIGVASVLSLRILIQMERNLILSRLWNSTPGRISFNSDFVGRIALYGAVPLVTLVSWVFPDVGEMLFGWVGPVRQMAGY